MAFASAASSTLPAQQAPSPSFQLAPSPSAQEAAPQTDEVDPFYLKLFEDGKYFFQNGQYGEAARDFEIASFGLINNPGMLLECYAHLAVAHSKLKNTEKAKRYFDEINRQRLWEHPAAAQVPKALRDEYTEATIRFLPPEERALAQKNALEGARKKEASRLLAEARAQKSVDKKADLYVKALEQDSSNIDIYFELSRALCDGKRYKRAAEVMALVSKAGISDSRIPVELGTIHLLNKKYDRAISALREGRTSYGDSLELGYLLGRAYLAKKMYGDATAELARVVERAPDYKDAAALLKEARRKSN